MNRLFLVLALAAVTATSVPAKDQSKAHVTAACPAHTNGNAPADQRKHRMPRCNDDKIESMMVGDHMSSMAATSENSASAASSSSSSVSKPAEQK